MTQISDLSFSHLEYLVNIHSMLSPENLMCDGESSVAEANNRRILLCGKLNEHSAINNIDRIIVYNEFFVYCELCKRTNQSN